MSEALKALEKLRSDALEQARSVLANERALLAQADALVQQAAARLTELSERVCGAQHEALLERPSDFVWAERAQRAARLEHARCATRLSVAESQRAHALTRFRQAEQGLLAAELDRRALSQVVSQRDRALAQKREQRSEEDAADAHRARPR